MDNIRVAIRVRPLQSSREKSDPSKVWHIEQNSITQCNEKGRPIPSSSYTFDQMFDTDSKTDVVYEKFAKQIVLGCMEGVNGTIFAYGQTSSGKTHTMMGMPEEPGIIPLAFKEIINYIEKKPEREFLLRCYCFELYNEDLYSLLHEGLGKLAIREKPTGEVYIENLPEYICTSADDLQKALEIGLAARRLGATKMNEHSSRSHTIFRVVVESRPLDQGPEASAPLDCPGIIVAELNLVDLAGSERASLTGADGVRLKEGAAINKSLLALSSVISKLSEGKRGAHIPYRDSKLTRILQNSLGGNTRTIIIGNITPAVIFAEETISTLKFASRAKQILNSAVVNEIISDAVLLQRYRQEILQLQEVNRRLEEGHSLKEIMADRERLLLEKDQTEKNFASLQQHALAMEQQLDTKLNELDFLRRMLASKDGLTGSPFPLPASGRQSFETDVRRVSVDSVVVPSPMQSDAVKEGDDTVTEALVTEREAEVSELRAKLDLMQQRCSVAEEKLRELEEMQAFREDECNAIVQDTEAKLARMITPSRLHAARSEASTLESQLQEKTALIEQLQQRVLELESNPAAAQQDDDSARKRRSIELWSETKRRRQEQQRGLNEVEDDIAEIRAMAEQLHGTIAEEESKRYVLEDQVRVLSIQLEEKDRDLRLASMEMQRSALELQEAQDEMMKAKEETFQAQKTIGELQHACETALSQMALMQERVQASENLLLEKTQTANEKMTAMCSELDMLRATQATGDMEPKVVEAKMLALQQTAELREQELKQQQQAMQDLKTAFDMIKASHDEIDEQLQTVMEIKAAMETEVNLQTSTIDELKQELAAAQAREQQARVDGALAIEQLTQDLALRVAAVKTLEEQVCSLQASSIDNEKLAGAESALAEANQRVADMAAEMEHSQEEMIAELGRHRSEIEALMQQLQEARQATEAAASMSAANASAQALAEIESLRSQLQTLQQTAGVRDHELKQQMQLLSEVRSAYDAMKATKQDYEEQLEEELQAKEVMIADMNAQTATIAELKEAIAKAVEQSSNTEMTSPEIDRLTQELAQRTAAVQHLEEQVRSLQASNVGGEKLMETERALAEANQRIADMATELENAQEEMITGFGNHKSEIDALTQQLQEAKQAAENAASNMEVQTTVVDTAEMEALRSELVSLQQTTQLREHELLQQQQAMQELKSAYEMAKNAQLGMEQQLQATLQLKACLDEEVNAQAAVVVELKEELVAAQDRENQARMEGVLATEQLTQELALRVSVIQQLEAQVHSLQSSSVDGEKLMETERALEEAKQQMASIAAELQDKAIFAQAREDAENQLRSLEAQMEMQVNMMQELQARSEAKVRDADEQMQLQSAMMKELQAESEKKVAVARQLARDQAMALREKLELAQQTVAELESRLQEAANANAELQRVHVEQAGEKLAAMAAEVERQSKLRHDLEMQLRDMQEQLNLQGAMLAEAQAHSTAELQETRRNAAAEVHRAREEAKVAGAELQEARRNTADEVRRAREEAKAAERVAVEMRASMDAVSAEVRALAPLKDDNAKLQRKLRVAQADVRALEEARSSEVQELRKLIDELQATLKTEMAAKKMAESVDVHRTCQERASALSHELKMLREQAAKDSISLVHAQTALAQASQQAARKADAGIVESDALYHLKATVQRKEAEIAELKKANAMLQEELETKEKEAHPSKRAHVSFNDGESLCASIVLSRPALQVLNGMRSADVSQMQESSAHSSFVQPPPPRADMPKSILTARHESAVVLPRMDREHLPLAQPSMAAKPALRVDPHEGRAAPVAKEMPKPTISEPKDPECTQS